MNVSRLTAGLAAGALAFSLAACGSSGPDTSVSDPAEPTASGAVSPVIGVAVLVSHPSLQLIEDGFKDVLDEQGVKAVFIEENAQADISTAATIASSFHENKDIDLFLAITTPIAQALSQVEKDRPILYAGVTDPVDAGLVPVIDGPSGSNITGTSDLNPNAKPVELIKEILPAATKIGVLYSSSEPNSFVQVQAFNAEADALGVAVKESAITNSSELATGVQALSDCDAIFIPTDNTVVSGIATVINFGEQNQIPVFTADADSVQAGTVATRGISYYELGRRTGEMAVAILVDGTPVGTIPALVVQETDLKANPGAAAKMGVTFSESLLKDAVIVETQS
ncbi:MAG: ABC transporter substrate-binding protein [Propionibacteriaceae bacterium]|jgi:putative ABC transport system substrate-binding protein|nr:ABC transporter substrate-binding protein [Propionibacteriaceae bacterium]